MMCTGLALNSECDLMMIDTGGAWPPTLITYSQDGRLIRSAPFLPLKGCTNASSSKCRFMECLSNSVVVVDLGRFPIVFISHHYLLLFVGVKIQ